MPSVFRFVDILGSEIHTIDDPEDKLPVPKIRQVVSIGSSKMRIEFVTARRTEAGGLVYDIRVRLMPAASQQLYKN